MTKKELIEALATQSGVDRKEVAQVIEALPQLIKDQVKATGKAAIHGLGTFSVTERAAREGRNPQTGATIQIPAKRTVSVKLTRDLRDAVAE